jgi:thymidylate synthase (FAD)
MPEKRLDRAVEENAEIRPTKRSVAPGLETYINRTIPILDHGFIRVVDYMGDDSSIVQAARVSYGRGTKTKSEDAALISYLLRHRHTTPFEMCEIKLHVKLPIFVARQWVRHRTASINEYSARYSILDREFYVPKTDDMAAQSRENRQGRARVIPADQAREILDLLTRSAVENFDHYHYMLNEGESGQLLDQNRVGLARELARITLPLSTYTQWYWKIDLHNLLNFLRLRSDPHAQHELRQYSDKILEVVKAWVPVTYAAFLEHQIHGVQLSRFAVKVVRKLLDGEKVLQPDSGLSKREWNELMRTLGRD